MSKRLILLVTVLGLGPVALADAPMLSIEFNGSEVDLYAASIESIFATPGGEFSALDLEVVADTLVSGGISTQGYISLLMADTADGFSLIALFDGLEAPPADDSPVHSLLGVNALWQGAQDTSRAYTGPGSWMANASGDGWVGGGAFAWQHEVSSAGLAFSALQEGQTFDIDLIDLGLLEMQPQLFQLISFNGNAGFTVEATGEFDADGQIGFTAVVEIVIPAPASLTLLSIAGLTARRRRRRG